MTGRRLTVGLSLLCALVFCAFAASSASAAGTTAFTCVENGKVGTEKFTDADCSKSSPEGKFAHESFAGATNITVKQTSATAKLHGTIGGITTTLTATGFTGTGTLENGERASKEMFVKGSGTGTYTGVTVSSGPEGCKVKGETVKQLATTSETVAASMETEFKPTATNFAEFTFEGCKTAGLNTTYKISGTAKAIGTGAFAEFTEASTKTLKLGGQEAFFITTDTFTGPSGAALSATTTTP